MDAHKIDRIDAAAMYTKEEAQKHECGASQRISSSDWIEIISDTTITMPYTAGDVNIEHKSTVDDTIHVPANIIWNCVRYGYRWRKCLPCTGP